MVICRAYGLTETGDKQAVVKQVIADATDANGLLTYANVNYGGTVFTFTKNTDYRASLDICQPSICKLNGHFVLVIGTDANRPDYEAYLIKDPGAAANNNLKQPMQKYGASILDMMAFRFRVGN